MASIETVSNVQQVLASMFFGTAISFMLHGVTSCQMTWFFRSQSDRSGKGMMALVIFVWLAEAVNCAFMLVTTLNMFFLPAVTYAAGHTKPCTDWVARYQTIPSALCTFTVEGFFMFRVWKLSDYNKAMVIAFIPSLSSYGFGMVQVGRSFKQRCYPHVFDVDKVLVYGAYACRIFGDGIVVTAMCYILYRRSSGFTTHTKTIKIVRGLILWSISTGVLTWITSLLFLLSDSGFIPLGFTIFFIQGGLYVNAMLAQLNARTRFRAMAMADESIPLNNISFGDNTTGSSQPVDRELQLPDPT